MMMRVLTLVRHAKSSWDQTDLADFERPLNKRGLKNAPEMGKRLANAEYQVDAIISSPAVRAITTAKYIAKALGLNIQMIREDKQIYEASVNVLIDLVHGLDNSHSKVMFVGHNPGFTSLCNYLSNSNIDNMPTCSIAQIQFDVDHWNSIIEHSGKLIYFDYPKKK